MRLLPTLLPALVSLFLFGATRAAEPAGYRLPLLDGPQLDRWVVTGCEAEVRDDILVLKAGNGLVRSHHRYSDFVLELQWRPGREQQWDSGIFFRAELPWAAQSWPDRYQVELRQGEEGSLAGRPETRGKPLALPGQWNRLKLTVIGAEATLEINGQVAWKVSDIELRVGYIGLQAAVPGGGQFEFKDVVLTELGHRSLFNGTDLSGWEGGGGDASSCWKSEDSLLVCTGQKGTWLRSQQKAGDFNLRLEYKLRAGGNSGVYIRVPPDGNHHGAAAGIEVQILDDAAERYKNLKPYQFSGSLYAILAAEPRVSRPAGEWNTLEINCQGTAYRVVHNGILVVSADEQRVPDLQERLVEGFLGLQNHNEEVWFRHLRLGPPE